MDTKDLDLKLTVKQGVLVAKLKTKTVKLDAEVDLSGSSFLDQQPGSTGRSVLQQIGQILMAIGAARPAVDDDDDGGDGGDEDEAEPPARKDAATATQ